MDTEKRDFSTLSEEELLKKQMELEAKEQHLDKKERELSVLEAAVTGAKYNIYDKINVSLKTMDYVIMVLGGALALALVAAFIMR
ncbi:MAG: hypothetical protein PHY44_02350 [Lachnospiraceae bacterium]|nr:hypothetical protein [Lachnospiraceae bacterium]